MEFPPRKKTNLSPRDLESIDSWIAKMKQSGEGRQIITNMLDDPNVPERTWQRFLQNIARENRRQENEILALHHAIADTMLLQGPEVNSRALSRLFARILRLRDLMRYLDDGIPVYQDEKGQRMVYEWITNETFKTHELLKKTVLRGLRPILWATLHKETEEHFNRFLEVDDLCDKLGLRIDKHEYVVELRYPARSASAIRKPTVIEAGPNPLFLPSAADEEIGFTRDLLTNETGLPEVVHEPISTRRIVELLPRGMKSRDADLENRH